MAEVAIMRCGLFVFLLLASLTLNGLSAVPALAQDADVVVQDNAANIEVVTSDSVIETPQADLPEPVLYERLERDEIQRAFRRMKRDDNTQWELRTDLPERQPTPGWARALGNFFGAIFEFLMPVFKVIFWVGLGALACVLLYAIFTSLRGVIQDRAARESDEPAVPEYRPTAKAARILLDDADALAAEGRFAEAIHLILYRSIQDIEKARPKAIRLSLTSREISRSPALGPQTRTIFSGIARFVEQSHFGGRAANADDYAKARALYAELATAPTRPTVQAGDDLSPDAGLAAGAS